MLGKEGVFGGNDEFTHLFFLVYPFVKDGETNSLVGWMDGRVLLFEINSNGAGESFSFWDRFSMMIIINPVCHRSLRGGLTMNLFSVLLRLSE